LIKIVPPAKEAVPSTIKRIHFHDSGKHSPGTAIRTKAIETVAKVDAETAAQAGGK
jgi:hypothetical protein